MLTKLCPSLHGKGKEGQSAAQAALEKVMCEEEAEGRGPQEVTPP